MQTDKTLVNTFYTAERNVWREWLLNNFEEKDDVWFIFPMKGANQTSLSYNDAVEEALCFGWIDSTIKNIDKTHRAQHFTKRRKNSTYSRPNIERLIWLEKHNMIHESVRQSVLPLINAPYVFPQDIIEKIKSDAVTWQNYNNFADGYKRIRVAYIDAARKRPEEFNKRLKNFIEKTQQNKLIKGFGGIEKYYI